MPAYGQRHIKLPERRILKAAKGPSLNIQSVHFLICTKIRTVFSSCFFFVIRNSSSLSVIVKTNVLKVQGIPRSNLGTKIKRKQTDQAKIGYKVAPQIAWVEKLLKAYVVISSE